MTRSITTLLFLLFSCLVFHFIAQIDKCIDLKGVGFLVALLQDQYTINEEILNYVNKSRAPLKKTANVG